MSAWDISTHRHWIGTIKGKYYIEHGGFHTLELENEEEKKIDIDILGEYDYPKRIILSTNGVEVNIPYKKDKREVIEAIEKILKEIQLT